MNEQYELDTDQIENIRNRINWYLGRNYKSVDEFVEAASSPTKYESVADTLNLNNDGDTYSHYEEAVKIQLVDWLREENVAEGSVMRYGELTLEAMGSPSGQVSSVPSEEVRVYNRYGVKIEVLTPGWFTSNLHLKGLLDEMDELQPKSMSAWIEYNREKEH